MAQQFDEVQRLMDSIISIQPDNVEAHIIRFSAYIQTRNYEKCH